MTEEDNWITAAMADHTLVAHLLMKLNQAPPTPPSNKVSAPALRLDWSVKQRRTSKQQQQALRKKADAATRASPTTPLSWSGGGGTSVSLSASDGRFEESKPIYTARSEVAVVSDTPMIKRSRKRKTLLELREEECLLLKERSNLKNQLATLRFTVEKQRDANERLKADLTSRQTPETASATDKSDEIDSIKQIKVPCDPTSLITTTSPTRNKLEPLSPSGCLQKKEVKGLSSFVLPDLNLPVDENSDSNILCGVS